MSRIHAFFWRTFFRSKKYGGVPKMTIIRYAQIRSYSLPTQKCDMLIDRQVTFPRSPFQMFRFLMISILFHSIKVQRCFKGRKRMCDKGRKEEMPAKKKRKCKNHHLDEKEERIESPSIHTNQPRREIY